MTWFGSTRQVNIYVFTYVSDDPNGDPMVDGGGSGPVSFQDGSPTSGLTYSFTSLGSTTDDLEFSNDGGATYTYTPTPDGFGCDAAVKHFRVNPKGTFAADTGSGAPEFELAFRVFVN